MSNQMQLPEWMVNQALSSYLGKDDTKKRFFELVAVTPDGGGQQVRALCGFDWVPGETAWAYEKGLRLSEAGKLDEEEFKKRYWTIRPDFRFWTHNLQAQLIVEGKGYDPSKGGAAELSQAQRYFEYLKEFGCGGAIIYLVPTGGHVDGCLRMLVNASKAARCPFGVITWDTLFPYISSSLLRVGAHGVVKSARLLERVLELPAVRD